MTSNVHVSFINFVNILKYYSTLCFVKHVKGFKINNKKGHRKCYWFNSELQKLKEKLDIIYNLSKGKNMDGYTYEYKQKKIMYRHKIQEAKI